MATNSKLNVAELNVSSAVERAKTFWDLDLKDAESAVGVDPSVINSFACDAGDPRVPQQGYVLDKTDYLKD